MPTTQTHEHNYHQYLLQVRGVHPPWDHDAFAPCFRFPPISEKFSDFLEIFSILPFPERFLHFHPPKFLMTFFLVIDHKFRISPLFSLFQFISPLFRENYSFPLLLQIFPPVLNKFTCFLHTLRVYFPPHTLTMMHLCITQCTYWTPLLTCIEEVYREWTLQ